MRRVALSLALALVAAFVLCADAAPGRARFRLLTFNIRFDFPDDGPNRWRPRVPLIVRAIQESQAHVLCLQEDKEDQIADLKNELTGFEFLGRGRNAGGSGEHNSIVYSTEHFQVREHGDFWLSDTPDVEGSNTWGDRYPRKVTWALLETRRGGRGFLVLNTHFVEGQGREQDLRRRSAQVVLDWLTARLGRQAGRVPVILAGDFNSDERSEPRQMIAETGFRDAWVEAAPQARFPGTYHDFRGLETTDRIDWVLLNGPVQAVGAGRIETHEGNRYPSDHYPIYADLEVR